MVLHRSNKKSRKSNAQAPVEVDYIVDPPLELSDADDRRSDAGEAALLVQQNDLLVDELAQLRIQLEEIRANVDQERNARINAEATSQALAQQLEQSRMQQPAQSPKKMMATPADNGRSLHNDDADSVRPATSGRDLRYDDDPASPASNRIGKHCTGQAASGTHRKYAATARPAQKGNSFRNDELHTRLSHSDGHIHFNGDHVHHEQTPPPIDPINPSGLPRQSGFSASQLRQPLNGLRSNSGYYQNPPLPFSQLNGSMNDPLSLMNSSPNDSKVLRVRLQEFTGTGYSIWAYEVERLLTVHGWQQHLYEDLPSRYPNDDSIRRLDMQLGIYLDSLISPTIKEQLFREGESVYHTWSAMKSWYRREGVASRNKAFDSLLINRMRDRNVDDYLVTFRKHVNELRSKNVTIDELFKYLLLKGLGKDGESLQQAFANSTLTSAQLVDEIHDRFGSFQNTYRESRFPSAMLTQTKSHGSTRADAKSKKQGVGRKSDPPLSMTSEQKERYKLTKCKLCNGTGHPVNFCPKLDSVRINHVIDLIDDSKQVDQDNADSDQEPLHINDDYAVASLVFCDEELDSQTAGYVHGVYTDDSPPTTAASSRGRLAATGKPPGTVARPRGRRRKTPVAPFVQSPPTPLTVTEPNVFSDSSNSSPMEPSTSIPEQSVGCDDDDETSLDSNCPQQELIDEDFADDSALTTDEKLFVNSINAIEIPDESTDLATVRCFQLRSQWLDFLKLFTKKSERRHNRSLIELRTPNDEHFVRRNIYSVKPPVDYPNKLPIIEASQYDEFAESVYRIDASDEHNLDCDPNARHEFLSKLLSVVHSVISSDVVPKLPKRYSGVMKLTDDSSKSRWLAAIKVKLEEMIKNKMFIILPRFKPTLKPIGTQYVLTVKEMSERARLIARGDWQTAQAYSSTMNLTILRRLFLMALNENLVMRTLDVCQAFLNATIDEDIYLSIPDRYCLNQAGRFWFQNITPTLIEYGLVPLAKNSTVFVHSRIQKFLVDVCVDDLVIIATDVDQVNNLLRFLETRYRIFDRGKLTKILDIDVA